MCLEWQSCAGGELLFFILRILSMCGYHSGRGRRNPLCCEESNKSHGDSPDSCDDFLLFFFKLPGVFFVFCIISSEGKKRKKVHAETKSGVFSFIDVFCVLFCPQNRARSMSVQSKTRAVETYPTREKAPPQKKQYPLPENEKNATGCVIKSILSPAPKKQ